MKLPNFSPPVQRQRFNRISESITPSSTGCNNTEYHNCFDECGRSNHHWWTKLACRQGCAEKYCDWPT